MLKQINLASLFGLVGKPINPIRHIKSIINNIIFKLIFKLIHTKIHTRRIQCQTH